MAEVTVELGARELPDRGEKRKALAGQRVSYILTDRKYFNHRTYDDAQREREYLTALTGKNFKVLKLLNIDGTVARAMDATPEGGAS